MDNNIFITRHAKERIKERLKTTDYKKVLNLALTYGYRYPDPLIPSALIKEMEVKINRNLYEFNPKICTYIWYSKHFYIIFNKKLVTVLPIPEQYEYLIYTVSW